MNRGIISATRSTFSPDEEYKRWELAKAFTKAEGYNPSDRTETGFSDISYGATHSGYIAWAHANGLMNGYEDGTFRPNGTVTREEFCVAVYRYINEYKDRWLPTSGATPDFSDLSSISSWARSSVYALYRAGIVDGFDDGTFRPGADIIRTEAAALITRMYAYATTYDNTVNVYVKTQSGAKVTGAALYVYRPNDGSTDMYPESPGLSNSTGVASVAVSGSRRNLAFNVIHNDYGAYSIPTRLPVSRFYYFAVLPPRWPSGGINSPLSGFSSISVWGHTGSSNCNRICPGRFTRICPDAYYNATYPQNFGWRYGVDSDIEFHQAMDVGRNAGTAVYNTFGHTADVKIAGWQSNCGNTVQLFSSSKGVFATYMHLQSFSVVKDGTASAGQQIGTVGSTATASNHLHFSIATSNILYSQVYYGIKHFTDPLRYFG